MDDALAVAREETIQERNTTIAKNALVKGSTLEFVHDITGFDMKTIQELAGELKLN